MNRRNKTKRLGKNSAERWEGFHLNNSYVAQFTYLVLYWTKEQKDKKGRKGKLSSLERFSLS